MLTRQEKTVLVNEVQDCLKKSQGVLVTNLVGLPSNEANKIRKSVRDVSGRILIIRNSVLKKAVHGTSYETLLGNLKGTNAVAFAFDDTAAVAKVLFEAGKEFEIVKLKASMLEGQLFSAKQTESLAQLPSKNQMLATLLATFNAPISAFARVINAIKDKKSEEAP